MHLCYHDEGRMEVERNYRKASQGRRGLYRCLKSISQIRRMAYWVGDCRWGMGSVVILLPYNRIFSAASEEHAKTHVFATAGISQLNSYGGGFSVVSTC
jgi:hypothetical protein